MVTCKVYIDYASIYACKLNTLNANGKIKCCVIPHCLWESNSDQKKDGKMATLFSVYCVRCMHCTLYTVQCTLYSVHFTIYTLQCLIYH